MRLTDHEREMERANLIKLFKLFVILFVFAAITFAGSYMQAQWIGKAVSKAVCDCDAHAPAVLIPNNGKLLLDGDK